MRNIDNIEEALLSALCQNGIDPYYQIAALGVTDKTFANYCNRVVYQCLHHLFSNGTNNPDIFLIKQAADDLQHAIDEEYVQQLFDNQVNVKNLQVFAKKLKKLQIASDMGVALKEAQRDLSHVTGDESISDICNIIENKMQNIFQYIEVGENDPITFGDIVDQYIEDKKNNPVDQMGYPSGFPIWDSAIGGGLRKGAVQLVGARTKTGKSVFSKEVAVNVAKLNIPVLYLDTEMRTEEQLARILASESRVQISDIETGKFAEDPQSYKRLIEAKNTLKTINKNLQHISIAGQPIEHHFAIIRKWIINHVGLQLNGEAKDCLIIYDYFKLMDAGELNNLQEYQALGFLLSHIHNFCIKYNIPALATVQLNRDGTSKEDTTVISQSDRISWLCSSFSILKFKNDSEVQGDGAEYGNQKLVPLIARFGPGLEGNDYIHINFKKNILKMDEVGTKSNSRTMESSLPSLNEKVDF